MKTKIIVQFNELTSSENWTIVDDVVMGGESFGAFKVVEGIGTFEGEISLENNGGFSSVRYKFSPKEVQGYKIIRIQLHGDGKDYQFRIKSDSDDRFFYIYPFSTTGEWEEIEIPLHEMYPSFRGKKLDQPNFSHPSFEELAFLIGNKQKERFKLQIKKIELR